MILVHILVCRNSYQRFEDRDLNCDCISRPTNPNTKTVWTPTHESLLRSRGGGQLGSWSHGLFRELLFSQLYQILMRLVCVCEVVVVVVIGDDIRRCDNKRQFESLFWNNVFIILRHQSKLVVPLERKSKRSVDSEVRSIIVLRRFWNSSN